MTAVGAQQIRCDNEPCGKIQWRALSQRAGAKCFCSRECRQAYQQRAEVEMADERLRAVNLAYGTGFLCGVLGLGTWELSGALREQHLRGVMDGREARRA